MHNREIQFNLAYTSTYSDFDLTLPPASSSIFTLISVFHKTVIQVKKGQNYHDCERFLSSERKRSCKELELVLEVERYQAKREALSLNYYGVIWKQEQERH